MMKMLIIIPIIVASLSLTSTNGIAIKNSTVLPVVIWHGLGSSCCRDTAAALVSLIEKEIPGIYVHSLKIGRTTSLEEANSYFMPVKRQLEIACSIIAKDPKLQSGFNAVGLSQGGQFLRALQQKCPQKMHNLITLGSQHQGVFGFPFCPGITVRQCGRIRRLINELVYSDAVQNTIVPATYWHDPTDEDAYRSGSQFIADINNERSINEEYIKNLQSLNKFVMVKFSHDEAVQPNESAWFGYYKPGQGTHVIPMNETSVYVQDRLGLKKMEADGKLVFLTQDGFHVQISDSWFIKNIIKDYLR